MTDAALSYDEWQTALAAGDLLGVACRCGAVAATPKRACPACGSRDLTQRALPTAGTVYSETTIAVPPAGHDPGVVAVVDLGPTRLLGRVTSPVPDDDAGDTDGGVAIEIGDRVVLTGADAGGDRPAPVFRPATSEGAGAAGAPGEQSDQ
jgi:Predicted nucleic-acid-binding protein containing a Zn-ribbon